MSTEPAAGAYKTCSQKSNGTVREFWELSRGNVVEIEYQICAVCSRSVDNAAEIIAGQPHCEECAADSEFGTAAAVRSFDREMAQQKIAAAAQAQPHELTLFQHDARGAVVFDVVTQDFSVWIRRPGGFVCDGAAPDLLAAQQLFAERSSKWQRFDELAAQYPQYAPPLARTRG